MRLHLAPIGVVILTVAGVLDACSLFIPFDDYAGDPRTATPVESGITDALATSDVDEDGDVTACANVDTKHDPSNCGACGRKCVTGVCESGKCPVEDVFTSDAGVIQEMRFSSVPNDGGDALYYTQQGGALGRVLLETRKSERAPTNLATGALAISVVGTLGVIGSDASVLLFRENTFTTATPQKLLKRADVGPLRIQGNILYFGDQDGVSWTALQADASIDSAASPRPIAFTTIASTILWTSADGDVFSMQYRTPGNPATVVEAKRPGITSIAVTETKLYLGQRSQGLVIFDYDGTLATNPRRIAMDDVEAVVADTEHVYAIDFSATKDGPRLVRANSDGTDLIVLAESLEGSRGLVLSGEYVYFSSGSTILRTTK